MKLKELGDYYIGLTYKPESVSDDGTIVLRSGNIQNGKFDLNDIVRVKANIREKQYVKPGDILMCSRNGSANLVGKSTVIPNISEPMTFGAFMTIFRTPYNRYLSLFLKSKSFRRQLASSKTTTINQITINMLDNIEIDLPEMAIQEERCYKLEALQKVIDSRYEQLKKLDDLVKARFVEMFGDINVNDKGWDIIPLGDLCTIVRGGSPRPIEQFLGGDIPWIKIGDATDGENIYLNSTKEHIIQEGVKKSRLVKAGSLIFANCGVSLGFARIITFDGCIHDGWLALENIDERLNKIFLLQALNQMTDHFREIAPAGTQPNLNTAIMKSYKQIIPPMKLQNDFISFMEQVDKSKVAVQKSLNTSLLLFDSLMQKYFGG